MSEYFKFYWNHRVLNKISICLLLVGTFLLLNIQLRYENVYEGFGSAIMSISNIIFTFSCVYQVIAIILDTKKNNQTFIRLFVNPRNYVLMQIAQLTISSTIFSLGTFNSEYGTLMDSLMQALILFPMYLMIPILVSKGFSKSIVFIIKTNVVIGLTTGLLLFTFVELVNIGGSVFEVALFIMTSAYMLKNFFNSVAGGYYE